MYIKLLWENKKADLNKLKASYVIKSMSQHHKDVSSQLIDKFNVIPLNKPTSLCFMELGTLILNFIQQNNCERLSRKILKKKINVEGLDLSDIKT